MADERFPPAARLHDDRDYARVFHRQQKAAGEHVVVLLRPRGRPGEPPARGRVGVMVSTKTAAKAVRRHQLKRWVRELFRRRLQAQLLGWDAVVLFRRDPPADGHARLDREIAEIATRALAAAPSPEQRRGGGRPRRGGAGAGGAGGAGGAKAGAKPPPDRRR